jgi:hypothetical protein
LIQFHFGLKGSAKFIFNQGNYALEKKKILAFIQPTKRITTKSRTSTEFMGDFIISIKKFHALFSTEANYITFFGEDNKDKKYTTKEI